MYFNELFIKIGLNEVTEIIENKLREIETQKEQYEKEQREKEEQEKLEVAEKARINVAQQNVAQQNVVQQEVAQQEVVAQHPAAAISIGDHDQVSPANWERYQQLRNFKHNFVHGN